jgi:hypothetical protein
MFGGIDKERNCNNDLRIIRVGKKPLEWIKPNVIGVGPSSRYNAAMAFYEELEILIVHGGRNDKDPKICFNDVFILDLCDFKWIKLNIFDEIPKPRSEHCMTVHNNKLVIFGGINTERYIGDQIYLINLDYFENKKKKQEFINLKLFNFGGDGNKERKEIRETKQFKEKKLNLGKYILRNAVNDSNDLNIKLPADKQNLEKILKPQELLFLNNLKKSDEAVQQKKKEKKLSSKV